MSDRYSCDACGVEWDNHLGIQGTCQQLKQANAVIRELRAENERLKAELSVHLGSPVWPEPETLDVK